ncbi:polysaccharide biosynthesis protein [Candidatus Zixiibacteriota bacterium]
MFDDKTLLITGGTGSFGNAVLEASLETEVREIRIFSRDEKKQNDMRNRYNNPKLSFYVGDVRDTSSIAYAIRGVDYIFHAAALKQVPSCEFFPVEALKTNVLGTENVLRIAIDEGLARVVCLSTDKAVYPVNAMGMSKALMEKVMISMSKQSPGNRTVICGTRYGNVIGSRGSVVPLFLDQIEQGAPLTITDPNMTRFLMSLKHAIELVIYAFEHARPGDMFVQKSPACRIEDLALAVRDLCGASNPVELIGIRHGEKAHESLLSQEERSRAHEEGSYFRISPDPRDLNYGKYFTEGEDSSNLLGAYSSDNTEIFS